MFSFEIISLIALATSAWAAPTSPGPWCNGLGFGAFDVASNFTLAAWNVTLPNANNTGAPLVLGSEGAIEGAELGVISTLASYPYNPSTTWSLNEGALIPYYGGSTVTDDPVIAGSTPAFLITSLDPPAPAQIYCAVADIDPAGGGTGFPFLAVNGDTDSFSLCSSGPGQQTSVVWKAQSSNTYDADACYAVRIQLIELD